MNTLVATLGKAADLDTRERLIDAALKVFAEKGIDAATLREITELAGANLAAVNYYFRSKDELTRTALEACLKPINDARLAALNAKIAESRDGAITVEAIVEALVRPMVELSVDTRGGRAPVRLLLQVRALPRPLTNTILAEQFDRIHRLFLDMLAKALPHLAKEEIALRYDFARGAMMQILADLDPAARLLPGLVVHHSGLDNEAIIQQLVYFISPSLQAPSLRIQEP